MSHFYTATGSPPRSPGPAEPQAVAVWFEEILLFGEEILELIFLPLFAGRIYLFDSLVFKALLPGREDIDNLNNKKDNGN